MIKINGLEFSPTKFPNGEIGIEIPDHGVDVEWSFEGDHELVHIRMIADRCMPSTLDIRYLPYSRMDRVQGDWAFTLKTVCELINDCGFYWIKVAEPHSDVSVALLNGAEAYYPTRLYFDQVCENIGFIKGEDYIIFPDGGAEKRYGDWYNGHRIMVGHKKRNFETGKIESFRVENITGGDPHERQAIIIDDLCSYGGTFVATAAAAQRCGILDVTLLVAHLETSVHKGEMIKSDIIKNIYATNSIYHPNDLNALKPHPKIHLYEVEGI